MKKNKKQIIGISIICFIVVCIMIGCFLFGYIGKNKNKKYELEKITKWNYFTIIENDKMGVIDNKGNVIIEPNYEDIQIPNPTKDIFICSNENETKIVNAKGEEKFKSFEEVSAFQLKELATEIPFEKSVLKYKENGKYGIMNFDGKKVTKAIYDSIENLPFKEGELLVQKDGKYGVINILGKNVIPMEYKEIKVDEYYEAENSYKYSGYIVGNDTDKGTMYKYINYEANKETKEEYQDIKRIVDYEDKDKFYLIFEKDNKYGIIEDGNVIVNNEYDNIEYDSFNKLFIVKKDNNYGVLKLNGETLISCLYDDINIEGIYIYALKDEEQIIFSTTGEKINNSKNKSAYNVENTNYKITINDENKYGVIDENNNDIIPNEYYYIGYLGNDYFVVSDQTGKNGVVDNKGKIVLETKYDTIEKPEKVNLIEATEINTNTITLFDTDIKEIAKMNNAKIFEGENYIRLYSNKEQKYFNSNGEEKSNKDILSQNKIFSDVKDGKWGFVDSNGNVIVDYIYDDVTETNQYGFAGVKKDGKWGSINENGQVIIEPTYTLNNNNEVDFIGEYYKYTYGYKKFNYTNDR